MEMNEKMLEQLSVPNTVVVDGHLKPLTDIKLVSVEGERVTLVTKAGIAILANAVGWTALAADELAKAKQDSES